MTTPGRGKGPSGQPQKDVHKQAIVIGSGFGGVMAAWALVNEGLDVLMLERGPWVERGPHNWDPEATLTNTAYFRDGSGFTATTDRGSAEHTSCSCVGGPSVFYGGVSMRYREDDFRPNPDIVSDSGADWPFRYSTLRPFYREAEQILNVAGSVGEDPTEPPRTEGYPASPSALSPVSQALATGARSLGLRPFRLPLAINYETNGGAPACIECATCDTFACGIGAKNDLAVRVLPTLMRKGLEIRAETAVTRLVVDKGRVAAVECRDGRTGEAMVFTADRFVLAAGALVTPHLLLVSGLAELNPAGDSVGRYLTRHCSGIAFGAYPWLPKHEGQYHKQLGINDYYFGDPGGRGPKGKLGNMQQTQTPSIGTVRTELNPLTSFLLRPLVRRITGLLVIAEDRPQYRNRVTADPASTDRLGLPGLVVDHRYHERDLEARSTLGDRAKAVHKAGRALGQYMHEINTFSHALGTVRMGPDETRDPLDGDGRFRGLDNLYVTDGAALPTSAGVNPSLTIAANALRVGRAVALKSRGP